MVEEATVLVREHIPLEQGLRRQAVEGKAHACAVREHIPLEQGLRQHGTCHR